MVAEARVQTEQARRHLRELCGQLRERAETKGAAVRVEWTETDGIVEFDWARCTIRADETTLALRAEAADEAALRQVCELLARHLEHAGEERLALGWSIDGAPPADTHANRRDTMRGFHRRMRH